MEERDAMALNEDIDAAGLPTIHLNRGLIDYPRNSILDIVKASSFCTLKSQTTEEEQTPRY